MKLGGYSNNEVADIVAMHNQMKRSDAFGMAKGLKTDIVGNSFDIAPLLSEIQDLKRTIQNKPETNIALENIVQGVISINRTTKQGNTTTRTKHRFSS